MFQALSPPEQSILLNGLQPNTEYGGTVQVVNSTGVTVDSIPIIFTTTSGELLSNKVPIKSQDVYG